MIKLKKVNLHYYYNIKQDHFLHHWNELNLQYIHFLIALVKKND